MSAEEYWTEVDASVLQWRAGQHPLKYAPLVNVYRSLGFMLSTMAIAQACPTVKITNVVDDNSFHAIGTAKSVEEDAPGAVVVGAVRAQGDAR